MTKHHDLSTKKIACKSVKSGISINQIVQIHKCDRSTLWRWRKRSNEGKNIKNLIPLQRSGRPPILSIEEIKEVRKDILNPATKFGFETDFWTAKRIQIHLKKKNQIRVTSRTICRWLRKSGLS